VTPCAICTMHIETRSAGFLVKPQNQGRRFVNGLVSKPVERFAKTTGTVLFGLASKLVAMVFSGLASKSMVTVSPGLVSKSVVGFLAEPQNKGGGQFPGLDLKTGSYGFVICALKSL
jgi:hypothetical protein